MDNIQPTLSYIEVTSFIKTIETSVRERLQPGVTLNVVEGASECNLKTDAKLLTQVIMNLLFNACRFTPKGSITLGYEVYDDELYFFVKDTGNGITPDLKARIAALFDDGDTASPGLGYGLPISYSLVKKLGGNIGVESRGSGRGSTFWFTLPYNAVAEVEEKQESHSSSSAAAANTAIDPAVKTILVAEDNIANSRLFEVLLKKKYNVVHASDGIEAVELFKKINPDLIIMDIQMPNLDGYGAVREIRKISQTVPIVAATAYAFVTDRQRLLENGFNGYVSKPINPVRLEKEINACLGIE